MADTVDQPPTDESPQAPPDGTRLPAWKKLLFSIAVVVILVGGLEIVCRVLGLGASQTVAHYVSDWHRTPDGQMFWVVRGAGYNRDGMRDRDHAVPKPPGTYRIVCLGDSVTAGHGVSRNESYPAILQAFFDQMGLPVEMEVFNIAVSGWSTLQESIAYRSVARPYQPDHVFLGLCLNDVAEMNNNMTEPPPAAVAWLVRHSAMIRWLINAEGRQVHDARELFAQPEPPAVQEGWSRVLEQVEQLRSDTRADGCELSVIIFPFRFQLGPDAPPPHAQQRVFQFCFERGIPCLDLLPALKPMGTGALIDESHLSPEAAALVARELIRWGQSGCVACGHDLSGVPGDRCPRCGSAIRRPEPDNLNQP